MNTLLLAIIGHLVGDYLVQNDWMALHKKQSTIRCLIHCLIWTLSVMLFAGWPLMDEYGKYHLTWWTPAFVVLLATHFIQDRTNVIAWWMDLIGQKQFRTGICSPWSIIVVDNVWHIVTIWAVWKFII